MFFMGRGGYWGEESKNIGMKTDNCTLICKLFELRKGSFINSEVISYLKYE